MKILIIIILGIIYFPLQAQQDSSFTKVEKMPSFHGGVSEMYKFIYSNLQYPKQAKINKISGQVITQFVVDSYGRIRDIEVIRGIGYGCDEEAIRVVELMNAGHMWMPGLHNGRAVPVTFTLPIKFVLF